jgi:hypothetical protein
MQHGRQDHYWLADTIRDSASKLSIFNWSQKPVNQFEPVFVDPCGTPTEWDHEWHLYPLIGVIYLLLITVTLLTCFIITGLVMSSVYPCGDISSTIIAFCQ